MSRRSFCFFFFNDTATTEIYTLSLHDALPIWRGLCHQPARQHHRDRTGGTRRAGRAAASCAARGSASAHRVRRQRGRWPRSEEHTSELQSQSNLVCRLLLEKKKQIAAEFLRHPRL